MTSRTSGASNRPTRATPGIAAGCLYTIFSTVVTCVLLFINGGLVMAAYSAAAESGYDILTHAGLLQFVLFAGPICLVVIQWLIIDFVFSHLRRSS